jgi:hypothetical protein
MENIFVEFLPPWIETGLQPAFYDKESGTVLQQTARMYARVNMLIRMFNKLSRNTKNEIERFETAVNEDMTQYKHDINETVADYIEKFNQLHDYVHDYFDNLDVQEEINNKLDDMVEQGTLQEIITTYIQSNVAWVFDTVADMKLATNLVDGSYAQTLGFYSVNDGGGGLYKITATGTANEMDVIAIGSTLYANLITDDTVNILQLGAKANDENYDNQPHLQRAFDLKKTTIIGDNVDDIFWVQSASRFYNSIIFNSWLKNKGSQGREIDRVIYIENVWSDKTIEVINPLIDGNRDTSKSYEGYNDDEYGHGINIRSSQNIKIIGGKIINCYGDSLTISTSNLPEATRYYSNNILVENVYMDDAYRNTISIISGTNVTIRDCETYNRNGYRDILVEPNDDNRMKNENIIIDGGYHYSNGHTAVIDYCSNRKISNVKVSNCTIENGVNVTSPIRTSNNSTYKTENAIFENITILNHHTSTQILMGLGGNVELKNCKIIGDSNIAYFAIATPTGDIVVDNLYVDVKDNENNSKNFSITMKAENGVIRFSNNVILSKNSSSNYSTQVTATQAKLVYFVNNYLYKAANAFGIGNHGETTQTHAYPTNCVYMIDNYVKALDTYPSSRAIIVHYSADVTSLYSNYNFYDGITTKYVVWGDLTNRIGDAFN